MGGTLVTINFTNPNLKFDTDYVYFGRDGKINFYRWPAELCQAIATTRERSFFFHFIELAGVNGVIACFLVVLFALLLCVLAFVRWEINPTILEVVKFSFTLILGFFFGSQTTSQKSSS
jgi:hypothetical protein